MIKIPWQSKFRLLFLLVPLLVACDSSDQIVTQQVDSRDRLTDLELAKLQQPETQGPIDDLYSFGFDVRTSLYEDALQYLPFLKYLESATGYRFKLHFTPKDSSTVDELGQNKIQFAAMGGFGYLKAQSKYAVVMLARGLNQQNKAEYRSAFIVPTESSIQNIKQIKGMTMAFGAKDSTQGDLIPRIELRKNDIQLQDLRSYNFTGSHQYCAEVVLAKKYDVCAMQDTLADLLSDQELLKIIHLSAYYPSSGIVANQSVPVKVVQQVRQALLDFDPEGSHSQGLYHWERTEMPKGFITSSDDDFFELRKWAAQLGLLPENDSREER